MSANVAANAPNSLIAQFGNAAAFGSDRLARIQSSAAAPIEDRRGQSLDQLAQHLGGALFTPEFAVKARQFSPGAFVAAYAALRAEAQRSGATHVFVDEAHFYADVDLRGKWVLKGTPALVDSTSPR